MIFAYGKSDPLPGKDAGYHGVDNKGTKQALLISGATNKEQDVQGLETMDFLVENVSGPCSNNTVPCFLQF